MYVLVTDRIALWWLHMTSSHEQDLKPVVNKI